MGKKEEEEKKDRAMLLLERKKIIFNLVLFLAASFVVLIGVLTMAWFAKNTVVKGKGPGISAKDGAPFVISFSQDAVDGAYYDYHEAIGSDLGSGTISWKMRESENFNNFGEDAQGIKPGSAGIISFEVTPLVDSTTLQFEMELVGYVSETSGNNVTMTEISSDLLKNYLRGHVMFFQNYDSTNEIYSNPILCGGDAKRVFTKTITGRNTPTTINIYWVWPELLSDLVDVTATNEGAGDPFTATNTTHYANVLNNVCTYPTYYFKLETTDPLLTGVTEQKIGNSYSSYSGAYDDADNDIGTGIEYLLLKMSITTADGD